MNTLHSFSQLSFESKLFARMCGRDKGNGQTNIKTIFLKMRTDEHTYGRTDKAATIYSPCGEHKKETCLTMFFNQHLTSAILCLMYKQTIIYKTLK